MWTPKRVLLLSIGAGVFIAGYVVYAFFLGGIDGLPLLPQSYLPGAGPGGKIPIFEPGPSDLDLKLQQAFGPQCSQMNKSVKFEIRKRNLVVAADEVSFKEPDGRVKLKDVSVAMFKNAGDSGSFPEITTVTSPFLYLTFDQRIENPTDMNRAKLVGGELRGKTTIINNHATEERHDDLEVEVANEPLFYDDRAAKIWTDGVVVLLDKQTKPHPTKVGGKGLEIRLVKEDPKNKNQPAGGAAKQRQKSDLSDVEMITLKSMVEMHLFADTNSGFMSAADAPPAPPAAEQNPLFKVPSIPGLVSPFAGGLLPGKRMPEPPPKPPEKSHIVITTNGQFSYDVANDVARFESPPAKGGSGFADQVQVLRKPILEISDPKVAVNYDHLLCDLLTLKFRRRLEPAGAAKGNAPGRNREIESAHATTRPGGEVVLALDSENLHCDNCLDLLYECPTLERGARTVLRGEPLRAAKDGHQLQACELRLEGPLKKGAGQRIVAEGPGQVDLCDRETAKGFTTHAVWSGLLISVKVRENEREITELTFTKDAAFIDDARGWKLAGQTLKVRLEPTEAQPKSARAGSQQGGQGGGPRLQPVRVDAYEGVMAESADLRISKCNSLKVRFHTMPKLDANILGAAPPASAPPASTVGKGVAAPPPTTFPSLTKNPEKGKARKPIDLQAEEVVADVLRGRTDKHELQEVVATGNVHVRQEPDKPGDNGVDIKGRELNLLHYDEGDVLKVNGDAKAPAQLLLGDLYLTAPRVVIDQKQNIANAQGDGAMRLPSNTTLQGVKAAKPSDITVHFSQGMFFNGRDAEFNGGPGGGVFAYQGNSELRCQNLQVELDRAVSLKQGQRSGQSAKVEKVIAHSDARDPEHYVTVTEIVKDSKDQVIKQSQLICRQLFIDTPENKIHATGLGLVASLQYGTPEAFGTSKAPKQSKEANKPQQLMLTRVVFTDRMQTTEKSKGVRSTVFFGPVTVAHAPSDRIDAQIEPDKLAKGALWLQCEKLTVLGQQFLDGRTVQTMQAKTNVVCWTADMKSRAETVSFSEADDDVKLEGSRGNLAEVYQRSGGIGSYVRSATGTTIMFNRKTNLPKVDGASSLGGG